MLSLVQPQIILGLLMGGAVIYWFTGASAQAVVTGAYRAVVFIKEHLKLDKAEASIADSKRVVEICTIYAQKGMINIFIVVFCMALALSFFNPYFFIGYLVGIAFFGLFQAIFMANAGGAWDNAKKIVEVDLKQKGTELHAATVVGDTVGDPFKDTSSVAMNPIIKFTTLFGLLAAEIAVTMTKPGIENGHRRRSSSWSRWPSSIARSTACASRKTSRSGNNPGNRDVLLRRPDSATQLPAILLQIKLENRCPRFQIGGHVCDSALNPGRLAIARLFHRRRFRSGQSRLEKRAG